MACAHQAYWGYLAYGYVFAVWGICLLMQKKLADNLLAQVRKFRDQVVQLAKKMLCARKFPELIAKTGECGPEKPTGSSTTQTRKGTLMLADTYRRAPGAQRCASRCGRTHKRKAISQPPVTNEPWAAPSFTFFRCTLTPLKLL